MSNLAALHELADSATIVVPGTRLVTKEFPPRHMFDRPNWGWSLFRGERCVAFSYGMANAKEAREHALQWGPGMLSDAL